MIKSNSDFEKSLRKIMNSGEVKKKGTGPSVNISHISLPDLAIENTVTKSSPVYSDGQTSLLTKEAEGATIKDKLTKAAEEIFGSPSTEGIFDGLDNVKLAEKYNILKDSLDRKVESGELSASDLAKTPLRAEGLSAAYLGDDLGKSKLTNMSYKIAYSEPESTKQTGETAKLKIPSLPSAAVVNETTKDFYDRLRNPYRNTGPYINNQPDYDLTKDKKGLEPEIEPTPLEAAYMLQYAGDIFYPGINTDIETHDSGINGWYMSSESYQNDEGLDIAVFKKYYNGEYHYVIANVGSELGFGSKSQKSETAKDWKNNFEQPFGKSKDMEDSIAFAVDFVNKHPDANIIFIGHSKGGAEAAANAVATNKKAILFNPAQANLGAYGLDSELYTENMTSYVVDGEVLNEYLGFLPFNNPGKTTLLGELSSEEDLSLEDRINRHLIGMVIELLISEGYGQ